MADDETSRGASREGPEGAAPGPGAGEEATRVSGAPPAAAEPGPTRVMAGDADPLRLDEEPGPTALIETPAAPAATEVLPLPPTAGEDPRATEYGEAGSAAGEPPDAGQLAPGTVLFGEYEIVDVLGAGGMGEVYRARHRRLDEMRAIKVMHPNVAGDPTAAEFFDREAKALLSVRSDAVVNCHDLLSDDEGRVYLVMEMIDGISLADRIRKGGALPVDEVRTLARRVGAGLAAAHARGVIHRDLSPDNIILPGGRPEEAKLIDFGIAKVLAAGQQTILEGFKGKLAYASPEQLGFFDGHIDGRSDVYSLGLVLYAAATGHALPMGGSVVEAVDARRHRVGVDEDCPAPLRADIDALLALHPDDRPATLEGRFAASPGPGAPARPARGPARWVVGGLALAGLAAGAVVALRPVTVSVPVAEPVALVAPSADVAPEAAPEAAAAEAVPAVVPAAPRRDRVASAKSRLRIMGLLRGAQNALERDALTTPAGDNAYEKYREVLGLDPDHGEARRGIEAVAARLLELARSALARGDTAGADAYLAGARRVSPRHPDLAAVEALRAGG